jgi:hypothetical protein
LVARSLRIPAHAEPGCFDSFGFRVLSCELLTRNSELETRNSKLETENECGSGESGGVAGSAGGLRTAD